MILKHIALFVCTLIVTLLFLSQIEQMIAFVNLFLRSLLTLSTNLDNFDKL